MNYPDSPGYARNSDTSREAADMLHQQKELHGFITETLKAGGLTVDEMKRLAEAHFNRPFDRSTIAARFTELSSSTPARIVRTSETRRSPRNRQASVYVLVGQPGLPFVKERRRSDPAYELAQKLWDALVLARDGTGQITLSRLDLVTAENLAAQAGLSKE